MKPAIWLTGAALIFLTSASYGADEEDAPIRWHKGGMEVILKSSEKPIDIVVGDNPVDKAHNFDCKSAAGCVVVMSASALLQYTDGTVLCSYVDGVAGAPGCTYDSDNNSGQGFATTRTQLNVGEGPHIVLTKLNSLNQQANGKILSWEVEYTVYERNAKGTN